VNEAKRSGRSPPATRWPAADGCSAWGRTSDSDGWGANTSEALLRGRSEALKHYTDAVAFEERIVAEVLAVRTREALARISGLEMR
jgi:hypothetical protein